jgi:hypothetical protein
LPGRERAWLPPRWFVTLFWHGHRALVRVTRGRLGLWRPKPGGWGALRLTTTGRRTGQPRRVLVGYIDAYAALRPTATEVVVLESREGPGVRGAA